MVTIRDIAKMSGHSISTVSRVMNHSGYVSKAVRAKVEQVIAEANYVPNDIARDLSIGQTHNIGVVIPHADHPYFTQLIHGILTAAVPSHFRVTILPSAYSEELEHRYLEQLRRGLFDGLIFTSHGVPLTTLVNYLQYGPIVVCEDPGSLPLPAVFSNRETGYHEAFSWLKKQNATNIAFMFSRPAPESATSTATLTAFNKVFTTMPSSNWILDNITTFRDGYAGAEKMHNQKMQVKYIFTNGDDVAAGARQFYLNHHLPVPTLIGQEDQLSGYLLGLPTINHHFNEIGQRAFTLITNKPNPGTVISVPSEFILPADRIYA